LTAACQRSSTAVGVAATGSGQARHRFGSLSSALAAVWQRINWKGSSGVPIGLLRPVTGLTPAAAWKVPTGLFL
jgi:hypothetical protein